MGLPDRAVAPSTDSEARTADAAKVYLVGGGIASLAAAVFMIRDGDIPGCNITILEELDKIGGSLDGAGSAADGYVAVVAISGSASIGWMAVTNFLIDSDFKWLLLAFVLLWFVALASSLAADMRAFKVRS